MQPKCVLVIDDEKAIQAVIQVSLEEFGHWQVLTASSGQEGLSIAKEQQPDVILLDVSMPGMDGFMTLQHLKENAKTRPIPVMLLTAHVQPEAHLKFSQLAIAGVVTKPFNPMQLVAQVATTLGWATD